MAAHQCSCPARSRDLMTSSFAPLRDPAPVARLPVALNEADNGDVSKLATAVPQARTPKSFAEATKSASISCLDGPATKPVADWPMVIGDLTANSTMLGSGPGWWLWVPCASNWAGLGDDVAPGSTRHSHAPAATGTRVRP